jgi:hypothetical protein
MSQLPIFKGAGPASDKARGLARRFRESGLEDVADDLLELSPIGGYWKAIKGIGRVLGLGKDASEDAIASAIESASPAQKVELAELMVREKEAAYADLANERDNITSRHATDMMGDSKLSKTWRPIVGYVIVGAFLLDWLAWRILEANGKDSAPGELLANLTVTVVGFYFGSRGLQHVASKFAAKWTGRVGS